MKKIILSALCAAVLVGCSTYDSPPPYQAQRHPIAAAHHNKVKKCHYNKCGKFGMEQTKGDVSK
jgi:outer membrane biogenesis lipoprotein LolB